MTAKPSLRFLVAVDADYSAAPDIRRWLSALVNGLLEDGATVSVLARYESAGLVHSDLEDAGATVLFSAGETTDTHSYAEEVLRLASADNFDRILTQGFELSLAVAETERFITSLWSWLDDTPTTPRFLEPTRVPSLEKLARGSLLVLSASEDVRSQVESLSPSMTSKMRVVSLDSSVDSRNRALSSGEATLMIGWKILSRSLSRPDFRGITAEASQLRSPLRIVLVGVSPDSRDAAREVLRLSGLDQYPGLILDDNALMDSPWLTEKSVLLTDGSSTTGESDVLASLSHRFGLGLLASSRIGVTYAEFLGAVEAATPAAEPPASESGGILQQLGHDLPDFTANPLRSDKTRILLAGADFKFAGDIIDALIQRPDIEVKVDLFKANAHPQPTVSSQLLPWADVIIAEFAAKNAIWYSQNLLPHQSLIVHLHGYELLEDWIEELNIDAVTSIVFASEFYRQKALDLRGWPVNKLRVIPNSVQPGDLVRPKHPDARFHLGIVGIVPTLKRPDRALDLLEKLLESDNRYVLHIKGHAPWNYPWEWKKSAHQDSYRRFYRRIGENPLLQSRIAFEPFSPDMGNWLRKIGWILSPSTRETFHLAAIEGATSGAVPVAWRREGSEEIIGDEFNVDSTDEAAERILSANHNASRYQEHAARAQNYAMKYSASRVKNLWLSLLFELKDSTAGRDQQTESGASLSASERGLINEVIAELRHGDTDGALAVLDENIRYTAGATGPVKDLELFVRGVAAADERRFIHYLPVSVQDAPSTWRPLTVRATGLSLRLLVLAGLDRDVVDVAAPAALEAGYSPASDLLDFQPDRASDVIAPAGPLRFDRWAEAVKINVESLASERGFQQLVAAGPWWLAFAVSKAADALGVPFHWVISENESLELVAEDLDKKLSNNAVAQVVKSAFERADRRIVVDARLITPEAPWLAIDSVLSDNAEDKAPIGLSVSAPSDIAGRHEAPLSRRLAEPPSALHREMSSLRVATIAGRDFNRSLRALVAEVVEVPVQNYFETLDADLDALIIDAGADDSGAWKERISHSVVEGRIPTTKILDRARLLGIPSMFIYKDDALVPQKFFATVRKADQVAVMWPQAVDDLFALNPSSNTTATLWRASAPFEENLSLALRDLGIAVPPPTLPAVSEPQSPADEVPPDEFSDAEIVQARKIDRISLILATYDGADRISGMLESVGQQSLPHDLIELIVVENGKKDGTEALVRKFADAHPAISVVYLFEKLASAGNARNAGLEKATGDYVTFIDDDDYLQKNYLLSMWLTAGQDTLVIGGLAEETPQGELRTETPNNNRIQSLNGGRLPLRNRAGLLGLNACKLIPAGYIANHRFDAALPSGEDTVFMAGLLKYPELEVAPAAPMDNAMYVRLLRDNSLSRREATFGFAVEERVSVINHLHRLEEEVSAGAKNAVAYLADAQGSFIRTFLADHPEQREVVENYVAEHASSPEKIRLA